MAKPRKLQIDVKGPVEGADGFMEMVLIVDGRNCMIVMPKTNYQALVFDGVFVRDGKQADSAGIVNTTNLFIEQP